MSPSPPSSPSEQPANSLAWLKQRVVNTKAGGWLQRRWQKWKKFRLGDRGLFLISGAGLGVLVWSAYFAPGQFGFDATLEVSELRFTYANNDERTFLNTLNTPRLVLGGHQAPTGATTQTLILRGRFTSPDPSQQAQLDQLKPQSLTFSLADRDSLLEFATNPKGAIAFSGLLLQPNTRLDRLAYDPAEKDRPARLALKLSHCTPNQNRPCQVRFRLGASPLKLNGSAIAIAELPNLRRPNLEFTPAGNSPQILTFSELKTLSLDLPATAEATRDLFSGGLTIRDVQLDRQVDEGQNARDRYTQSTLLSGEARLKDKLLTLRAGQYLGFGNNSPGIQRLERLQIAPKGTGLQLFVSGEAKELSAGLNPKVPTQTIDPKLLQGIMSDEVINLLIGLCSGVFATLLGRLLEDDD